jgi:lipopolysaccharide transport system permease protein
MFVFGIVFRSRFNLTQEETPADFGLALFCGLNLFNLCSEVMSRSATLILSHPNLVKQVVFPLETLPVVATLDALLHCMIAFVPLLLAFIIFRGVVPWSFVLIPVFLLPLTLLSLACSLVLSALGVFVRDIQSIMGPFLTVLMFASAVFYPLGAIPQPFRQFIELNPLALLIESARRSIIWGYAPDLASLLVVSLFAIFFVFAAAAFFEKSRPAFADVL